MPYGDVGGNGSVEWQYTGTDTNQRIVDRGEKTDPGDPLVLVLKPRRRDAADEKSGLESAEEFRVWLLGELSSATVIKSDHIEIRLKIERNNPQQIRVRWGRDADGVKA